MECRITRTLLVSFLAIDDEPSLQIAGTEARAVDVQCAAPHAKSPAERANTAAAPVISAVSRHDPLIFSPVQLD
jgi:hypothetical protein